MPPPPSLPQHLLVLPHRELSTTPDPHHLQIANVIKLKSTLVNFFVNELQVPEAHIDFREDKGR